MWFRWIGCGLLATALWGCIPADPPQGASSDQAPGKGASPAEAPATAEGTSTDAQKLLAAVEAMKDRVAGKPRDLQINVALGNLYYDNGKFLDSIGYYSDALDQARSVENELVEAGVRPAGASIPPACRVDGPTEAPKTAAGRKDRTGHPATDAGTTPSDNAATREHFAQLMQKFDTVAAEARRLAPTDATGAAACRGVLATGLAALHARRGNSWYLIGNPAKARADHEAALRLEPAHPEALFFKGALILETAHGDPGKLAEGRSVWETLVRTAPMHPRAAIVRDTLPRIDELFGAHHEGDGHEGHDHAAPGPAPLPPGMAEAAQASARTPELDAQLDATLATAQTALDAGKWQEALDTAKTVMPLRPDGRVALLMGVALRELGKPTAERVLQQATRMPGGDTDRAKYELAVLYSRSNPSAARPLLDALRQVPAWADKAAALDKTISASGQH